MSRPAIYLFASILIAGWVHAQEVTQARSLKILTVPVQCQVRYRKLDSNMNPVPGQDYQWVEKKTEDFVLEPLTPGHYEVQIKVPGKWIRKSVSVHANRDAKVAFDLVNGSSVPLKPGQTEPNFAKPSADLFHHKEAKKPADKPDTDDMQLVGDVEETDKPSPVAAVVTVAPSPVIVVELPPPPVVNVVRMDHLTAEELYKLAGRSRDEDNIVQAWQAIDLAFSRKPKDSQIIKLYKELNVVRYREISGIWKGAQQADKDGDAVKCVESLYQLLALLPNHSRAKTMLKKYQGNASTSPKTAYGKESSETLITTSMANRVHRTVMPVDTHAGRVMINSVKMNMIRLAPGTFMMGSHQSNDELITRYGKTTSHYNDEFPQHEVQITRPFYIATNPVTRKQFGLFVHATHYVTTAEKAGFAYGMGQNNFAKYEGMSWKKPGFDQPDDHPAVCISYEDAQAFCTWLSDKEKRRYNLPTEAQWEYACRAGTTTAFWWGDEMEKAQGMENLHDGTYDNWYATIMPNKFKRWLFWEDGFIQTSPVGHFKPNAWGLYEMHGNVFQWVRDGYAPYPADKQIDPTGPQVSADRVIRGGSWSALPHYARSAKRMHAHSNYNVNSGGFRVVLEFKTSVR